MPVLHYNEQPRFTISLIKQKIFKDHPFIIIDVGARGGVDKVWNILEDQVHFIGFEPDKQECEKLNKGSDNHFTYLPYALDHNQSTKDLYLAKYSSAHSLCKNNLPFWERFDGGENYQIVGMEKVQTICLEEALKEHEIFNIDFIKIDAEGVELGILKGGENFLKKENCLGVLSEVRFNPDGSNCPVFWQLDEYLLNKGMRLFDLDCYRQSRKILPYPNLYDVRDDKGEAIQSPHIQGQVMWGDALYFHDFINSSVTDRYKILKMICLLEIHGLNDCAAELIIKFSDIISLNVEESLNALVPKIKDRIFTYKEYMNKKEKDDRFLRPALGTRYPDMIITQYDGELIPFWKQREWLKPFIKNYFKKVFTKLLRLK